MAETQPGARRFLYIQPIAEAAALPCQSFIILTVYFPFLMKAIWKGQVIAESDRTMVVEGNHYFPKEAVKAEFLRDSPTHTTCPWKGVASYYSLQVDGETNRDAAWYYPQTKDAAKHIEGYVAFWKGVKVTE
jgi:uncharacterized protein (DUF427 family)